MQETSRQKTSYYFLWSFFLLTPFILILLAAAVKPEWIHLFDQLISSPILSTRQPSFTPIFIALTELGDIPFIVIFVLLFSVYLYYRKKSKILSFGFFIQFILGAGLLNQILKYIFRRPRPEIQHLVEQGGYSFPSGHSMAAMVCYAGMAFILIHQSHRQITKFFIVLFASVLILFVGISRIYLGVHFPTDVIGGYSVGGAWLALIAGLYCHFEKMKLIKEGKEGEHC